LLVTSIRTRESKCSRCSILFVQNSLSRYRRCENCRKLHIREVSRKNYYSNLKKSRGYARASYHRHIEERRKANREYHRRYAKEIYEKIRNSPELWERQKAYSRQAHNRTRAKAFEMLGGAKCANCGCDAFEFLEINHLNGGGRWDAMRRILTTKIVTGAYKNTDFNVLCRVCNALYYISQKSNTVANRFKVIWS
jgi:hypothetical protein